MANALSLKYPLQNRFYDAANSSLLKKIMLVVLGNFLLAISAKISIPLIPVPVTMQTLAVLLIGMTYGWRLGAATVLTYLIEGFIGLPVFASALGITWGYLIGFLPAVIVSGFLVERGFGRYRSTTFLAGAIGMMIIYACGVIGLSQFSGFNYAINFGVKPFLLIDSLKVLLLAATIPMFWKMR